MRGIILDDNGNLLVRNNSLAIDDNQAQVAQHLLVAFTGEFKHAPLLGGNAKLMINGKPDPFWISNIKSQLKTALVNVASITINDKHDVELILNT